MIDLGEGYPKRRIFAKKSHIESGKDGRRGRYPGTFRPYIIRGVVNPPEHGHTNKNKSCTLGREEKNDSVAEEELVLPDSSSYCSVGPQQSPDTGSKTAYISDGDRADEMTFWFSDDDEEEPPAKRKGAPGQRPVPITSRPRILSAQHGTVVDIPAPLIDVRKYSLIVNTLDAIVTVRRKQPDQTRELWKQFNKAKKFTESTRKQKLVASCSSPLTLYTVENIRRMIERWCAWNAAWVYDARPSS